MRVVLLLFLVGCFGGVRADSTNPFLDNLRHELAPSLVEKTDLSLEMKKCVVDTKEMEDPSLYVCVSFSMSDQAILALSEEASAFNGVLILRGIPDNSFKVFAQKVLELKKRGLSAEIQINPSIFQKYGIEAVPTFVKTYDKGFHKISGNISIGYAIEMFAEEGEP